MAQLAARNPCGMACTTLTGRNHLVVMHHRDDSPTLSAQEEAARASDANIMKIPKKPSKESCQFAYFFYDFPQSTNRNFGIADIFRGPDMLFHFVLSRLCQCEMVTENHGQAYTPNAKDQQVGWPGTADIFRGIMVSLYVKGKENGHVQAYAPTGAMGLK